MQAPYAADAVAAPMREYLESTEIFRMHKVHAYRLSIKFILASCIRAIPYFIVRSCGAVRLIHPEDTVQHTS